MDLLNRVRELCEEQGITLATLQRNLGFSNNVINRWDRVTPGVDKLEKVADYFNVSTDYLIGRTPNKRVIESNSLETNLTEKEERDLAKTMKKIKEQLISEEGLMFDGDVLDEETAKLLLESIEQQERMIKVINRKYTPKKYRK